ncbi:unnamed protein product [Mesocestoides corti]|uniref:Uncharacterized protein n=1 Tax=Mesocestoides corti TaxID=53468 RepID=A0A0R3UB21_MESCO|nr:unnamed protein product [Mesocestoides corti]
MSKPVLPRGLRKSERMQCVWRWVNSIPLDAPTYVQNSLTQIEILSDPKSFPDELSLSDHTPIPGGVGGGGGGPT